MSTQRMEDREKQAGCEETRPKRNVERCLKGFKRQAVRRSTDLF